MDNITRIIAVRSHNLAIFCNRAKRNATATVIWNCYSSFHCRFWLLLMVLVLCNCLIIWRPRLHEEIHSGCELLRNCFTLVFFYTSCGLHRVIHLSAQERIRFLHTAESPAPIFYSFLWAPLALGLQHGQELRNIWFLPFHFQVEKGVVSRWPLLSRFPPKEI